MSALAMARSEGATAQAADNTRWLRGLLLAQRQGRTCLPPSLGLDADTFARLRERVCPDASQLPSPPVPDGDRLREELLALRRDEWQELRSLLLAGRAGRDGDEALLASVVAAGCLGGDHLWRDLGLASRLELHELLSHNFPGLASRNTANMRWKKFFYKQLCEQDGGYVCRSPSCEQCPTYHDCFGEES